MNSKATHISYVKFVGKYQYLGWSEW